MWSYHAIWRITSACCNVDASVTVLVGGCRDAVPGVSRRCHRSIGGWFQKISILGDQPFHRKPHMELYVLLISCLGKNFPDTRRRMEKSNIHQRISGLTLDQDIIHIHLCFHKNKWQLLSPETDGAAYLQYLSCRWLNGKPVDFRRLTPEFHGKALLSFRHTKLRHDLLPSLRKKACTVVSGISFVSCCHRYGYLGKICHIVHVLA